MRFLIIWPERRLVADTKIERMFADALANGEIEAADRRADNVTAKARALHCAGVITLGADKSIGDDDDESREPDDREPRDEPVDQLDYPWNEPGAPFRDGDY